MIDPFCVVIIFNDLYHQSHFYTGPCPLCVPLLLPRFLCLPSLMTKTGYALVYRTSFFDCSFIFVILGGTISQYKFFSVFHTCLLFIQCTCARSGPEYFHLIGNCRQLSTLPFLFVIVNKATKVLFTIFVLSMHTVHIASLLESIAVSSSLHMTGISDLIASLKFPLLYAMRGHKGLAYYSYHQPVPAYSAFLNILSCVGLFLNFCLSVCRYFPTVHNTCLSDPAASCATMRSARP